MNASAWVQTYGGKQLWMPDWDASVIDLDEVATVQSRLPRFGGRTTVPYVVAEHSVRVADCVRMMGGSLREQWCAINHEGDEVLLGFDPPSPMLRICPGLRELKRAAHAAYCARFGLPAELPEVVKRADLVLLATEKRDLMLPEPAPWVPLPTPLDHRIVPLSTAEEARWQFRELWLQLANEVGYCGPR